MKPRLSRFVRRMIPLHRIHQQDHRASCFPICSTIKRTRTISITTIKNFSILRNGISFKKVVNLVQFSSAGEAFFDPRYNREKPKARWRRLIGGFQGPDKIWVDRSREKPDPRTSLKQAAPSASLRRGYEGEGEKRTDRRRPRY